MYRQADHHGIWKCFIRMLVNMDMPMLYPFRKKLKKNLQKKACQYKNAYGVAVFGVNLRDKVQHSYGKQISPAKGKYKFKRFTADLEQDNTKSTDDNRRKKYGVNKIIHS